MNKYCKGEKQKSAIFALIIFGRRRLIRYFQISKKEISDPKGYETLYIMTNKTGNLQQQVALEYSLRNWIDSGFKQIKDELGWADFRVTDYASLERWWEIVISGLSFSQSLS